MLLLIAGLVFSAEAVQTLNLCFGFCKPCCQAAVLRCVIGDLAQPFLDALQLLGGVVDGLCAAAPAEQLALVIRQAPQRARKVGRAHSGAVYLAVHAAVAQESRVVQLVQREGAYLPEYVLRMAEEPLQLAIGQRLSFRRGER